MLCSGCTKQVWHCFPWCEDLAALGVVFYVTCKWYGLIISMGCFPNGKIISVLFPNSNKLVNLRKKKKNGKSDKFVSEREEKSCRAIYGVSNSYVITGMERQKNIWYKFICIYLISEIQNLMRSFSYFVKGRVTCLSCLYLLCYFSQGCHSCWSFLSMLSQLP